MLFDHSDLISVADLARLTDQRARDLAVRESQLEVRSDVVDEAERRTAREIQRTRVDCRSEVVAICQRLREETQGLAEARERETR